jgi:hypothetical protein
MLTVRKDLEVMYGVRKLYPRALLCSKLTATFHTF